jgi:hypothetical protein
MMPVTLGAAVLDGDGDGGRAELAEVWAGLGVPSDGSRSGEELDALWPPAVPEHPATIPRAAPAEPRSTVRRETTLNCGSAAKDGSQNPSAGSRDLNAHSSASVAKCLPDAEPEHHPRC